jgi:hypothetical protein
VKKQSIANVGAAAALLCLGSASALAQNIAVHVNGDPVYFRDQGPTTRSGRVLVPLRGVLEKMGADVFWNSQSQLVTATRGTNEIRLPIGSRIATVDGREVTLDVPASMINGRTMVPLRFVSESLGAEVAWNGRTQTVMIDTTGRGVAAYREPAYNEPTRNANRNTGVNRRAYRSFRAVLPANTVIPVEIDQELSSRTSREGDRFTATIARGRDSAGLPEGTRFEGIVREAIPSRNGKPGVLSVDFDRVVLPDGTKKAVNASLASLEADRISRNGDRLEAKGNRDETMKWVGIGAGAGLLLGTLTKGNTLVDTVLGAGAGYLYSQLQKKGAGDVTVNEGTDVGVRIDRRVVLTGNIDEDDRRYDRDR